MKSNSDMCPCCLHHIESVGEGECLECRHHMAFIDENDDGEQIDDGCWCEIEEAHEKFHDNNCQISLMDRESEQKPLKSCPHYQTK